MALLYLHRLSAVEDGLDGGRNRAVRVEHGLFIPGLYGLHLLDSG